MVNNKDSTYINKVVKEIEKDSGTILFITKHGSHLYGTNTLESDKDYAILYKPSLKNIILGTNRTSYRLGTNLGESKNTPTDIDIQAIDIRKAIKLFAKGEIFALDLFYSYTNTGATLFISDEYKNFIDEFLLSKRLFSGDMSGVLGYIQTQASKYGVKGTRLGQVLLLRDALMHVDSDVVIEDFLSHVDKDIIDGTHITLSTTTVTRKGGVKEDVPSIVVLGKIIPATFKTEHLKRVVNRLVKKYGSRAERSLNNDGIDWKAISHAFRAIYQYKEVVRNGAIVFPFKDGVRKFLIDVKAGKLPFVEVKKHMEDLLDDLKNYAQGTRSSQKDVEDAILWFYKEVK